MIFFRQDQQDLQDLSHKSYPVDPVNPVKSHDLLDTTIQVNFYSTTRIETVSLRFESLISFNVTKL